MAIKQEVKLRSYQVEGVNYMLSHNYVLNADEPGLGKSLQTIAVQQSADMECLIVCPFTLMYMWQEEFFKFTDETDVKVGLKPAKVNIINYEKLYKCTEIFMKTNLLVVFDECHYLLNMDSKRTTYAQRMIENHTPDRMILLTGTPIKERIPDIYSLLRLLSLTPIKNNGKNVLADFRNRWAFNNYFTNKDVKQIRLKGRNGKYFTKDIISYSGSRNEEELKSYLKFKFIRRLASKVLDLPKVIFKDVWVNYKDNPALEEAFDNFQKGLGFDVNVKHEAAVLVAEFTAKYVKELLEEGESPIIVFSDYIKPLNIIQEHLDKKFRVAYIIGEVGIEDRQKTVTSFQKGEIDVVLCSYKAAATGITLTRSRNMVLNDVTWELSSLEQALKRFDRIGQERTPIVHRVVGTRTESRISKSIDTKREAIKNVVEL